MFAERLPQLLNRDLVVRHSRLVVVGNQELSFTEAALERLFTLPKKS